ncbi:MAG: hypothetical protein ACTHJN_19290 [Ginsengibacter sp.]
MPQKLIFFDEKKCDSEIATYTDFIPVFAAIIEKFKSLNIGDFANEDFMPLLTNPKKFLFEKMMSGRPLEVGGSTYSRRALFNMIQKPIGYHNLIFEIEDLQKKVKNTKIYDHHSPMAPEMPNMEFFIEKYFVFDGEKISLKPGVVSSIERMNQIFVESEVGVELFSLLKKFEKLFNHEMVIVNAQYTRHSVHNFFDRYLNFDSTNKKFSINVEQVKMADNRGRVTI